MKKLLFILAIISILSACSSTKDMQFSRSEIRKEKKLTDQALVKKAVESRRYIIKLERMYYSRGGIVYLYPRSNYIIIDGNKAIISAAYFGRQYDFKPIAGISMYGRPTNYELTSNLEKGNYQVQTVIKSDNNSFDLYLTIGKGGNCTVSFSNLKLDHVSYQGYLVPIKEKETMTIPDSGVI